MPVPGWLCTLEIWLPTTFPEVHTLEEYAEDHGKLMKRVTDLHFASIDALFASGDCVCMRYTAEGRAPKRPESREQPALH